MERKLAIECLSLVGEEVVLKGWVETVRAHGKIAFFDLRDGSGYIQIVSLDQEKAKNIASLGAQDVVEVRGKVKKRDEKYINSDLDTGTIEVELLDLKIIVKSLEMPFDMGGRDLNLELPTLLDNRPLTLRHETQIDVFKIEEAVVDAFRKEAKELGCVEIFVPTISASSTEGGAEVFEVDYYDHDVYLTQSPQLYKQMMVPVFERVFTISHAYRAEPSVTTRHLAEVVQMDCEIGFADFEELLGIMEEMAVGMLEDVVKRYETIFIKRKINTPLLNIKVPRLKLSEAQEIIFKETGRDVRGEPDLSPQDEINISAWAAKNHKSDLLTITHFPLKKRAFYTMPDSDDPTSSLSYDILFKGLEISSGSQRIHNHDKLVEAIKGRDMDPEDFAMYLSSFKYGMPPEGGFSFGLERITMKLLDLPNIREAALFPRDMERVDERFSVQEKGEKE